jgi:polysaccharide export outer membrane protein
MSRQRNHAPALVRACGGTLLLAAASLTLLMLGCTSEGVTTDAARIAAAGTITAEYVTRDSNSTIDYSDQIQISVPGYPEFSTTATVKLNGAVTIPLLGEVQAAGLTRTQFQQEIMKRLSNYVKAAIIADVVIVPSSAQKIIVLGAVNSQGGFPASSPTSIFQILATAGGLAQTADVRNIRVYRSGNLKEEVIIDLSGVLYPGESTRIEIPTIYPGDLMYVPRSENVFREISPFIYDLLVLFTIFSITK